ncbi:hypothetical protein EV177_008014 [Coemansia sp. RSA 1804]|nr:hypothetical protein EV177_008014 [Coemansia sp. RSA 1804]
MSTAERAGTTSAQGPKTSNNSASLDRSSSSSSNNKASDGNIKETPLPWGMLLVIMSIRLSEPVNVTLFLTFAYKMVEGYGVANNPQDVAFYTGLLLTSGTFCQALTIMHWGRLSDRIGRRPILYIGLTGTIISNLVLGLTNSYWVALAACSFNGFLSGNVVVVKTIVAEISDDSNRPRMMALVPFMWNVGSIAGAAVGGLSADPAHQYPGLFGDIVFFQEHPYFLPCAIGCMVSVFAFTMAVFKLKETRVLKDIRKPVISTAGSSSATLANEGSPLLENGDQEAQTVQQPRHRTMRELMTPTVVRVMTTNFLVCLAMSMGDHAYPMFAAVSTGEGGLGFTSRSIGVSLAISTMAVIYMQLVVYPRIASKYGVLFCYQRGQMFMTIPFICIPFLSILSARLENTIGGPRFAGIFQLPDEWNRSTIVAYTALWTLLMLLLFLLTVAKILVSTSINLITVNIAPSRSELGFMNGAQQMGMTVTRTIGPVLTGYIWSWSSKHALPFPFNSHFVWTVALVLTAVSYYASRKIPQSVNKFAAKDDGNDSEDSNRDR